CRITISGSLRPRGQRRPTDDLTLHFCHPNRVFCVVFPEPRLPFVYAFYFSVKGCCGRQDRFIINVSNSVCVFFLCSSYYHQIYYSSANSPERHPCRQASFSGVKARSKSPNS